MKSFQDIYDFCHSDSTYNVYFNVPDEFSFSCHKQYKYYYGNLKNGISRTGTFYCLQAERQLNRFLRFQPQTYHFHVEPFTYNIIDYHTYKGLCIYICAHIKRHGVEIQFNDPLKRWNEYKQVYFVARSHRQYNVEGIIHELKNYINKNLLFPPGRFRDLQIQYKVSKNKFVSWYRAYKKELKYLEDLGYDEMVSRYTKEDTISIEESLSILESFGVFHVFGINSIEEKEDYACQFMNMRY